MRFLLTAVLCLCWIHVANARDVLDFQTYGSGDGTIYIFTSPSCSHCREFHKTVFPDILKRFANNHKAQVVIVDMPTNVNALEATMLMRCLPEDKALKMMGWIYENQSRWMPQKDATNIFLNYVRALGMSNKEIDACLSNKTLQRTIIEQRQKMATLYNVTGTPTTVVRKGNAVQYYPGTDRKSILDGLERDLQQ